MSVRCHPRHVRAAKLCTGGARNWFKHNGIDWNEFVGQGVDESVLLSTNDPLAARVVEAARQEAERG